MNQKKAYVLIFDGLADWEPALALCEINKQKALRVVTVGYASAPVITCGGIPVVPQATLDEIRAEETGLLILPGGDPWEEQPTTPELLTLLQTLEQQNVPIAAICGATLAVGRAGLLKGRNHTSNGKAYLKNFLPDYAADEYYRDELAVSDRNLITASGIGSVEFAYEIIKLLKLYEEQQAREWFDLFKHAIIPQAWREAAKGN
jgi:putative intracellular protease/amidase